MPTERHDHFSGQRAVIPQEIPEGAPVIHPEIIAWLEEQFPLVPIAPPYTADDAVSRLSTVGVVYGQQQVIAYLKLLVRGG